LDQKVWGKMLFLIVFLFYLFFIFTAEFSHFLITNFIFAADLKRVVFFKILDPPPQNKFPDLNSVNERIATWRHFQKLLGRFFIVH
jgi:hypothetical protein